LRSGRSSAKELLELGEVEQPRYEVDLVVAHVEAALQLLEHACRARPRDLQADRLAEPAAPRLELDRLEQAVRLVGDREVSVPRHAEGRALDDLHHRKQPREEVPDHSLERHEQPPRPDRQKARQQLGDLHAREALLAVLLVADEEAEAEREPGDVRERLPGTDGERGQDGEDLALEHALQLLELRRVEILDLGDDDPLALEGRLQVTLPELGLLVDESSVRSRIPRSAAWGVSPSGERTNTSAATWSIRPATRTMKNSSMFEEKMEQKFTRSSSGTELSAATSSTRALKSRCESSRFRKRG
jgi:hypothetical protein